jgi:CHAT domain-containing protein
MSSQRFSTRPVDLLVLSACQTAAGDERAALGLAGVAVKAGARSALASLWQINDESTAELIGEFYRQLATAGSHKASALRGAQLRLMNDQRYRHPAYWSPFLLIGDWR